MPCPQEPSGGEPYQRLAGFSEAEIISPVSIVLKPCFSAVVATRYLLFHFLPK
jgi:hypothetical protein